MVYLIPGGGDSGHVGRSSRPAVRLIRVAAWLIFFGAILSGYITVSTLAIPGVSPHVVIGVLGFFFWLLGLTLYTVPMMVGTVHVITNEERASERNLEA